VTTPEKIMISPHIITIRKDAKLAEVAQVTGAAMEDTQEIILDKQLGPSIERETLLHEAMHHIWHQTPLDRTYEDQQEEEIIWTLAPRILSLILDNPEFVTWLQEVRK
jgi:hypothetical protein